MSLGRGMGRVRVPVCRCTGPRMRRRTRWRVRRRGLWAGERLVRVVRGDFGVAGGFVADGDDGGVDVGVDVGGSCAGVAAGTAHRPRRFVPSHSLSHSSPP